MRRLGLVLLIAAHTDHIVVSADDSPEGVAAGGISSVQEAELHRLLQATSEAILELPAGHRSKDKLRLLHAKLESLRAAAPDAEEHEWDAMVQALLDSSEYGSTQLEALLQGRGGAAAPACDADGAGATVGRRLQESAERPPSEEVVGAPSASGARGLREAWASLAVGEASARRWDVWKRWMLDRPPPWERDCDCCYTHCPEHLNCLLQSDNLYLACRGASVGQVLDKQWAERPCTLVGGTLLSVLHQHQTPALARPERGSYASSGRAWRLRAARHSQGKIPAQ